jgi:prophage tail gpP-like protein
LAAPSPNFATIVVESQRYNFWESLIIERTYGLPVSYATFQSAEIGPTNKGFAGQKFGCGNEAQVFLSGQLAASGQVAMRQVAYNGTTHAVQIRVHSYTTDLTASTVDAAPGQYVKSSFAQIVGAVCQPLGISVNIVGNPPGADKIFKRVSEHVGELRLDFISRLAVMRNLHMIDDAGGKTLNFWRGSTGGADGAAFF